MLELVRRDDESNPAKGAVAARELIFKEKVAVIFGGLDTPVALAIVPIANQEKVPFIGPWAAGTPITKNGANPNYVFRVSAVDESSTGDAQLRAEDVQREEARLILVNNPWGESNEKGLTAALAAKGHHARRHREIRGQRRRRRAAIDAAQGRRCRRAVPGRQRRPVGAGGEVARPHGLEGADRLALGTGRRPLHRARGPERQDVHFVQTYSFFGKQSPVGEKVMKALMAKYPDVKGPGDITPAVGVANAYDAMMLAALAIETPAPPTARRCARALQDRPLRRPDQDLRQALHAANHDALSETTTSGPSSSTTASCRS